RVPPGLTASTSRGRRLTARISVLDPEPDRDRERSRLVAEVDLRADVDALRRIAESDRNAHELGAGPGQAPHLRGAARQDDLADAMGSGLCLVELERRDDLACEAAECP